MRLVRFLPERWHQLTQELAKFGTIGVINLFVNFAVFNLLALTILPNGQLKAKAVATIVATTCAYFMNRHWTYRDRPKSTLRREYALFFFFNLVGLVIEVAVVGLAKYGLSITHLAVLNIFTAIGIGLGTAFRFWSYRTHVFRPTPEVAEVASAEVASTVAPPVVAPPVVSSAEITAEVVTAEDQVPAEVSPEWLIDAELDGLVEDEQRVISRH